MKRGEVLDHVKNIICKDRNNRHGEPENSFPMIAEEWSRYLKWAFGDNAPQLLPSQVADMLAIFKDCRFKIQPQNEENKNDQIGYIAIAQELRAIEATAPGVVDSSRPTVFAVGGAATKTDYVCKLGDTMPGTARAGETCLVIAPDGHGALYELLHGQGWQLVQAPSTAAGDTRSAPQAVRLRPDHS